MRVYKDVFNGDELFTDSLPAKVIKVNDVELLYEVETKQITRSKVGNIDIGSNPSAEEGGDEGADGDNDTVTVNNLVDACKLVATTYDKKSYTAHIKAYMKRVIAKVTEAKGDVKAFQGAAQAHVTQVLSKFDDYEFYTGETMDPEAMVVLKVYKEDGIIPYFLFWQAGLKEEKY